MHFEIQRNRLLNLQLMERFGGHAWRVHCDSLDMLKRYWQTELGRRKEHVHAINMKRRHEQMEVGKKIDNMRHRWQESSHVVLNLVREKDIIERQNKRMRANVQQQQQQEQQQRQEEEKEGGSEEKQMVYDKHA